MIAGPPQLGWGLEGKAAVVTGAAGGIGAAVAAALAAAGARVALVDLDPARLQDVAGALPGPPGWHLVLPADVADIHRLDELFGQVIARFGRFDVLAHLAATLRRQAIDDVTEDDWDAQHDVNLKATFFLDRAAARRLIDQGRGGRIVNFTSQGWWTGGFDGSVVYSASKGGVVSLTRGLARRWAPHGITVNAIAPGAVDTAMMRSGMAPERLRELVASIPMGRMARPDELAAAVVFLASDQASYITGTTLNVSGGLLTY